MTDLVSICIPTYNGDKYLIESLNSVLNQTYSDLEVLVQDDGSNDRTIEIVKKFQRNDKRIRLLINKVNLGLVENWNSCIKKAKGDWIKLHFQDDLMAPDALEKMLDFAVETNVQAVLTDRDFKFETEVDSSAFASISRLSHFFKEKTTISREETAHLVESVGVQSNFIGEPILGLVRKELFSNLGMYDAVFKQIPDFEFWLRLMLNIEIGYIPERLHTFRVHSESESARNSNQVGINPSHSDRVCLTYKFFHDSIYESFRSIVGIDFTKQMHQTYVEKYTSSYGRRMMKVHFDKRYLQFLPYKNKLLNKAISLLR